MFPDHKTARLVPRTGAASGNTEQPEGGQVALTDVKLRHLKPRGKPYIEAEGGGLYVEVSPHGTKAWKLRYRLEGR